jgi:hypothetical protein
MNKMQLEILVNLPKRHFDAVIKLLNNKVTDEDLKPMFPQGWNNDSRWPEEKETNAERWAKWQPHQIRIDYELERMVGCYDDDQD